MTDAIVGACAVLAGVLLQALIGERRERTARRRSEFVTAINGLLKAFVEFRSEQYLKIEARRAGQADTLETRRARWAARSAFTTSIDVLHTATDDQALLDAAEEARQLVVALGDTAGPDGVDDVAVAELGDRARQVHTALRNAAHHALHH